MSIAPLAKHRPKVVPLSPSLRNIASPEDTGQEPAAAAVRGWLVQSLLLEAALGETRGDVAAAARALHCALHLAEHDHPLFPFLFDRVAALVERRARRAKTRGNLREPLTESEMRVLRYLPTDLSKREIANELYVSVNTVKSHVKHLYTKLDARTRRQAVARARELGLLKHRSSGG